MSKDQVSEENLIGKDTTKKKFLGIGTEHIPVNTLLEAVLPLGLLSAPTTFYILGQYVYFGLTWINCNLNHKVTDLGIPGIYQSSFS